MNISQRQATIFVLGFQLAAMLLLWLNQLLTTQASDPLVLGAGLAAIVYGAMFFGYLRGWEYARHLSVVFITLIVATFLPEPFVTTYAPFLILLGPVLALVLLNPRWVIGSAAATVGILLVRAGGAGVYANLATLLNFAMLIAGLAVSRMISDSTRVRAEKAEETARKMHDELELEFQKRTLALSQTTTLLETMLEYVPDQIYFKDAKGRFIRNSKAQATALGLSTPAEVVGKTDFDFFPHAQRSYDEEQEIIQSGKPLVDFEEWVVWPNNMKTWVSTSKMPLRDQAGKIIGTFGISRDITERKRNEEALQKAKEELEFKVAERTTELEVTNEQLRLELCERKRAEEQVQYQANLLANINDAIIATDAKQVVTSWNHAAEELYGWKTAEALGKPVQEVTRSEFTDRQRADALKALSETGYYRVETLQYHRNGQAIWVEGNTIVLRDDAERINGFVAVNRDITERRHAEQRLRNSETRYRRLFESAKDGILILDAETGKIVDVNPFLVEMLGYSPETFLGKNLWELGFFTDIVANKANFLELQQKDYIRYQDLPLETADGQKINVEFVSNVYLVNEQKVIQCNVRDITERKRSEEKIERQNRRLSVLREIDMAILSADSVENIIRAALDHVRELVDCRRAAVALFAWGTNEALMFDVRTIGESSIPKGMRVPLAPFQDLIQTLSKNQTTLLNDLTVLPNPPPQFQAQIKDGLRSLSFLPLFSQGALIGSFSLASEVPSFFDEEKMALAREVANQLAIAITQQNLLEGLRDQQARTAGIINSAMDAIISIDVEQRIVLFNPAAEAMFGCQQSDAMGHQLESFLPERFRERHSNHIQKFSQTGVTSRAMGALGTIYGLRSNGEEFPIEASISQTQAAGKGLFTVILRDITARQHAEEALRHSQENFAKAFNANPAAIAITRLADGKFINLNAAYLQIMEYESHELLGFTAAEKNIYAYPEERARLVQQLQEVGSVQNYELRVRVKSGEIRNIIISMQPIHYNEEECILSVFLDISERKTMEAELQRSNKELEQFAYVASHDLQEPLRAVAGMVQLLGQRYKGKLDERADEYIGHAVEASSRMQNLINDLLDYSRVDRLGKPFNPTDLEKTLDTALANLQVAIQESGALITRDTLPTLIADSGQLAQVFQNLIGNAIKFRGERAPLIHIGAEKLENGWRFSVQDNGIGIEPQYFERIFLVFQRLHTRREYSGTGIGLSLCKKIVERHGGQIWVESDARTSSTFYFTIPERSS